MRNTKMNYMYRDASNYKSHFEIVAKGILSEKSINRIIDCLNEGLYFIPEQIGLPGRGSEDWTEDDHCWCELEKDGFSYTDEKDDNISARELVNLFEKGKDNWKEFYGYF